MQENSSNTQPFTRIKNILTAKHNRIYFLVFLIFALGVTVYLALHQQELRNRAAGESFTILDGSGNALVNNTTNSTTVKLKISKPTNWSFGVPIGGIVVNGAPVACELDGNGCPGNSTCDINTQQCTCTSSDMCGNGFACEGSNGVGVCTQGPRGDGDSCPSDCTAGSSCTQCENGFCGSNNTCTSSPSIPTGCNGGDKSQNCPSGSVCNNSLVCEPGFRGGTDYCTTTNDCGRGLICGGGICQPGLRGQGESCGACGANSDCSDTCSSPSTFCNANLQCATPNSNPGESYYPITLDPQPPYKIYQTFTISVTGTALANTTLKIFNSSGEITTNGGLQPSAIVCSDGSQPINNACPNGLYQWRFTVASGVITTAGTYRLEFWASNDGVAPSTKRSEKTDIAIANDYTLVIENTDAGTGGSDKLTIVRSQDTTRFDSVVNGQLISWDLRTIVNSGTTRSVKITFIDNSGISVPITQTVTVGTSLSVNPQFVNPLQFNPSSPLHPGDQVVFGMNATNWDHIDLYYFTNRSLSDTSGYTKITTIAKSQVSSNGIVKPTWTVPQDFAIGSQYSFAANVHSKPIGDQTDRICGWDSKIYSYNATTNNISVTSETCTGSGKVAFDVQAGTPRVGQLDSHAECRNNACTMVPGAGTNACDINQTSCSNNVTPPPPGSGLTPTPTVSIAPTTNPNATATLTPIATPTTNPNATATPTTNPSVTPVSTGTSLLINVALEGFNGARVPIRVNEPVTIEFKELGNKLVRGTLTYDSSLRRFKGGIDLGDIPSGTYTIVIKPTSYLAIAYPVPIVVVEEKQTEVAYDPTKIYPACDFNNDNVVNMQDVQQMFDDLATAGINSKQAVQVDNFTDITRDGKVDIYDNSFCILNFNKKGADIVL